MPVGRASTLLVLPCVVASCGIASAQDGAPTTGAVATTVDATAPTMVLASVTLNGRLLPGDYLLARRAGAFLVRVKDLEKSMAFYRLLGLKETRRHESEQGRFTLVFMAPPGQEDCPVELTYNWDGDNGLPSDGRHFGHLAYEVDDIHATCAHLAANGVVINRPPRDGHMAFVRSPDNISIELLQKGASLAPAEPWVSMGNTGHW